MRALPVIAVAVLLMGATVSPEAAWKAGIADQNKAYSQTPHAMLKIQDSAYLGDGQTTVLTGRKGMAASWRFHPGGSGPLRVSVAGGKLTMTLDGGSVDAAAKSIPIDADVDVAAYPTQVAAGVNGYRIFVFNQKNPGALNFKGVSYYAYDPSFIVTARFVPDAKLPPRVFRTSRGTDKQFFHAGDATFTLKGRRVTLPFYAGSHDPAKIDELSAFFTDGLTGKGAYGAGRYVDVAGFGKFAPASISIDFNQAYNPNCARSRHFTCPVAVDTIALNVTAGERDPHFH